MEGDTNNFPGKLILFDSSSFSLIDEKRESIEDCKTFSKLS